MIDDQVRQIAVDRRGKAWKPWDNRQMDRLKGKYITRPSKPASRFELLRTIRTGRAGRGQQAGTPSEYEASGIELLLEPEARRSVAGSPPHREARVDGEGPRTPVSSLAIAQPGSSSTNEPRTGNDQQSEAAVHDAPP